MRVVIQNIAIGLALSRRWLHSPIVIKGNKDKIHTKAGRLVCILEKGGHSFWMPSIFSVERKQESMGELEI